MVGDIFEWAYVYIFIDFTSNETIFTNRIWFIYVKFTGGPIGPGTRWTQQLNGNLNRLLRVGSA